MQGLSAANLAKWDFNPDEPRVPQGDPRGGEWTTGSDAGDEAGASSGSTIQPALAAMSAPDGDGSGSSEKVPPTSDAATRGDVGNDAAAGPSSDGPPIKWELKPIPVPPSGDTPPSAGGNNSDETESRDSGSSGLLSTGPTGGSSAEDARGPKIESGDNSIADTSSIERLPVEIPQKEPVVTQQRTPILRAIATWLGRAMVILGPAFASDPRVRMIIAAIEAATWVLKFWPEIAAYLDPPQTLEELQRAINQPRQGYQTHHIVEAQRRSSNLGSNSRRFEARLDSKENLVRVSYWKHIEISTWYSRPNDDYGGLSPRDFLRGKSWDEQYQVGIDALRGSVTLDVENATGRMAVKKEHRHEISP